MAGFNVAPHPARTLLVEEVTQEVIARGGGGGHIGGMDDAWRTKVDDRLLGLEKGLLELKGDVSGLKIAASVLASAIAIGAAVLGAVTYSTQSKVDALAPRLADEFRAMRTEQAATTSAIANSITATKQQAPQVILVPAPQVQQPTQPQH
ncbi:hypothetical protein [Roseomonas genomospecies 6]|uniref:Uncharacterized protein n=1 Tax=Roseomonas genomospecies 6 TaxID=214106 RepID=A0A9W7U0Z2_9PROT|nr:hypothetical protein [Roseomonas genomospecies 6]KAA0683605.1 hypothetical protein DS843_04295 [Roseomonas genomospecies 6]